MFYLIAGIISLAVCFLAYKLHLDHKLAIKRKQWIRYKSSH